MPSFFVPSVAPQEAESVYASFAMKAGCAVAPVGERIQSLLFTHNGEAWMAEVGKRLVGRRSGETLLGEKFGCREYESTDAAVVLAILPGSSHVVVTDGGKAEGRPSRWSSQFKVGRPVQVVRFAASREDHTAAKELAAA